MKGLTLSLLALTFVTDAVAVEPPASLRIRVAQHAGKAADLLDPSTAAWDKAAPTRVLLNRTPRIYQTEPGTPSNPPLLEVRGLRSENALVMKLTWDDATMDAPKAPPKKEGDKDDPSKLYKQPTGETSAFADAAAVMVPDKWSGGAFPSVVMGDKNNPARIYYWNATRGSRLLTATGRATQLPTKSAPEYKAHHAGGKWNLTLVLPAPENGYPVAFAIWDGHNGDRDGLKFFSIWYVLKFD